MMFWISLLILTQGGLPSEFYEIDVDSDGVNTVADRLVIEWWVASGNELSEVWEAPSPETGLVDLSHLFAESSEAAISENPTVENVESNP